MGSQRWIARGLVCLVTTVGVGATLGVAPMNGAENAATQDTTVDQSAAEPISAEQPVSAIDLGSLPVLPAPPLPPPLPEPVTPRSEVRDDIVPVRPHGQELAPHRPQSSAMPALNPQPQVHQQVKSPQTLIREREELVTKERRAAMARRQAHPPADPATRWADSTLLNNPRIYVIDRGMTWTRVEVPFRMHRHLP